MKFEALPKSATDFRIVILTIISLFSLLSGLLIFAPDTDFLTISFYIMGTVTIVSVLGEIFIAKSHKAERVLRQEEPDTPEIYGKKMRRTMLGFCGALILFLIFYYLIPVYSEEAYQPWVMVFTVMIIPSVFFAGFVYLPYALKKLNDDNNYYMTFGSFLMGQSQKDDNQKLGFLFQSVFLRAFFMVYLYTMLLAFLALAFGEDALPLILFTEEFSFSAEKLFQIIMTAYVFMGILDLAIAMLGYICTFKGLNADIRSMDPKMLGWFSCLICYQPLWSFLSKTIFISMYASLDWQEFFAGHQYVLCAWAVLILLSGGLEALSGATFGIRFSNVTYRGLITSGPYKYSKHPQYIAKMLNRFLTILPFIGYASILGMFQGMLGFIILLFIYFLRARTEENHLTAFPEYVAYANWMNENGIFRWIGKKMPVFSYDEERSKKYHIFMR